jgi:hypothetical protein
LGVFSKKKHNEKFILQSSALSCALHFHTLPEAENLIAGDAQTTIMVMIDSLLKFPYYSIIPSSSGHLSLLIFIS